MLGKARLQISSHAAKNCRGGRCRQALLHAATQSCRKLSDWRRSRSRHHSILLMLGLPARADDPMPALLHLRDKRMLLILPPKQKTLQATLHWSYGLLSDLERLVLRRLAVFAGHFTIDAALGVVPEDRVDRSVRFDAIDSLVAKSMVAPRPIGHDALPSPRYDASLSSQDRRRRGGVRRPPRLVPVDRQPMARCDSRGVRHVSLPSANLVSTIYSVPCSHRLCEVLRRNMRNETAGQAVRSGGAPVVSSFG